MAFRIFRQSLVFEKHCHYILSTISKLNSAPGFYREARHSNFLGITSFTRNCSTPSVYNKIFDDLSAKLLVKTPAALSSIQEIFRLGLKKAEGLQPDETILMFDCLSYCAPQALLSKKVELLEEIWKKLPRDVKKVESVFISYLNACRCNGISSNYNEQLRELGIHPTPAIMKTILACVSEAGNFRAAGDILEEMKLHNFPVAETEYASYIRAFVIADNTKEVNSVLKMMESSNIEMTSVSKAQMIQAYVRSGKEEFALKIFNAEAKTMSEEQLLQILQSCLQYHSSKDFIKVVLNRFPSEMVEHKNMHGSFKNICRVLISEEKFDELCTFVSCLPVPTFDATSDDFDGYGEFALNFLVTNRAPLDKILKFVDLLKDEKRNEMAMRVATGVAIRYYSPLVNDFLEKLSQEEPLRTHYFWPLLNYNSLFGGEMGIIDTLALMKKFKVEVDSDTLKFYVFPKLKLTLKDVEKGVKQLNDAGVEISTLLTPLTANLLFQQRYDETIYINSLYPTRLDTQFLVKALVKAFFYVKSDDSKIPTLAKLIKLFVDKRNDQKHDIAGHILSELILDTNTRDDKKKILQLIGEISLHKVQISPSASEVLQEHLSKELDAKRYFADIVDKKLSLPVDVQVDGAIKHPSEMSLEELECHLTQLQSKGMNTRGCLRTLLLLNVREKRIERALEVKRMCDLNNVEISPGMHAAILDIYIKTKKDKEAEQILRKLQSLYPGFTLDDHKIVDLAALLVEKKNFEDAQRILRKQAGSVKKMENIQKNIWKLLNNVAEVAPTLMNVHPSENQTRKFFDFLKNLQYCTYNNSLLGPIIREYLNKKDLKSAVDTYVSICKEHRLTPLKQELFKILVDACNRPEIAEQYNVSLEQAQTFLQTVIEKTTAARGQTNTNITFIVALAEVGTEKQLRKVLIDPKVRFKPEILWNQCEYLNASGKINALVKLAKCSRGLGHIQEQHIYNMILDTLTKNNDYKEALDLFEQISDDELKISNEFINKLVDLLKRNNLEIPTNVALYMNH